MASKRQGILEHLANTLFPTITIAGGYNFNLSGSERGLRSTNEMTGNEFPRLFVASADETVESVNGQSFISLMKVYIYGVVASTTATTAGDVQIQLDKLIEDTVKVLNVDLTQGNRVSYTNIIEWITDEGDQHPYAFFRMAVNFRYITLLSAP